MPTIQFYMVAATVIPLFAITLAFQASAFSLAAPDESRRSRIRTAYMLSIVIVTIAFGELAALRVLFTGQQTSGIAILTILGLAGGGLLLVAVLMTQVIVRTRQGNQVDPPVQRRYLGAHALLGSLLLLVICAHTLSLLTGHHSGV